MRSGEREKRLSGRQRRGRIISGNFEPAQEEMVGGDRRGMVSLVSFPDRLIHESSSEVSLPHHPRQRRQEGFRGDAGVGAKKTTSVNVPLGRMVRQRLLQVEPRRRKLPLE